ANTRLRSNLRLPIQMRLPLSHFPRRSWAHLAALPLAYGPMERPGSSIGQASQRCSQGGDPPILIDHPHATNLPGHPLHRTETACGIVAPFAPFALHARRNAIGTALIGAIRLSAGPTSSPRCRHDVD